MTGVTYLLIFDIYLLVGSVASQSNLTWETQQQGLWAIDNLLQGEPYDMMLI